MAETYWPFDAGSGAASAEDRWYQMAPLWAIDGVTASAGLAVTTLSGRNLQVAVGAAWAHGAYYVNDAAITLAIAANATGNPRIDRVVLRRSLTANTVTAVVVQGTAAASPTVPALTQVATGVWEVPIAQYRAETGFVNTDPLKITDERRITGAASSNGLIVCTSTTRPASPAEGMEIYETDTDAVRIYNGTAWNAVLYAPTKPGKRIHWGTNSSVATDGSGYATVTHGAGFTPAQVSCWWNGNAIGGGLGPVNGTDSMTATTFRLRATTSVSLSVAFVCYE